VGTFISAYLVHAVRIALAALVMFIVAIALWVPFGLITGLLGIQTSTLVILSAAVVTFAAFMSGGYFSARHITPGSVLHPVLAAAALGLLYVSIFTRGHVVVLTMGLISAAALVAALGALLGRSLGAPPNNRWRGP
jgi:hypothetical protein